MTQQKAASLTSSLFARKGKASPARLLISELEGAETETLDPAETAAATAAAAQAASAAAAGARANGVNGAARRKPKSAEADLPLLAFVEAQSGAEQSAAEEPAAKEPAGDLAPAASLLERGAQSLRRSNGRTVEGLAVPAAAAPAADLHASEPGDEPQGAAEAAEDNHGEEAVEAETVSGDANVAAIEDAPHDEEAPQDAEAAAAAAPAQAAPAVEAETIEDAVLVEPVEAAGPTTVETAADDTPAGAGTADQPETVEAVAETPAAETTSAEDETAKPAAQGAAAPDPDTQEPGVQPWAARRSAGDTAIPATMALRKAAALNPTIPAPAALNPLGGSPEAAVPPPVRRALPWRSAAVVALGAMLGLGGYLAISGKPAQPPAESVVQAPAATPAAPAAAPAAAGPAPQAAADPVAADAVAPAPAAVAEALPEPSFDIIRIEPDGQSIIAGRAQPGSEWILLNNGSPIATVQADANGEWVVLPDASLTPGANAFSLVPKAERGKVAIPAPVSSSSSGAAPDAAPAAPPRANEAAVPQDAPASTAPAEAAPGVALPKPKPQAAIPAAKPAVAPAAFRVSPDGGYEVQVASVREAADAERERGRLSAAYPVLLGQMDLRVQEASVEGAGTFFRVRSGAIADLGAARELCRQLEAAGQGCLVVRRAAASELPPTEVVEQAAEPAEDPGSAQHQQAERPQ
ncbi:MAG: hypothetical protein Kow00114_23190 [Kiloniellaceae bacterium]